MKKIRLIGRKSRLSLLQIERVKQNIETAYPGIEVQVIARNSRGDEVQNTPLHTVEGSDFFTQDIFEALANGEADIAVHSLKDMSGDHFFGNNFFAVTERDDNRDLAIFGKQVEKKIKNGETIIIGTCSPRREEMAMGFLQKALPQCNNDFRIETKFIRGNVDTRLRKLDEGQYDGIILATAGLNRLLSSKEDALSISELLKDKRIMLLPLIECPPAPCQGAIVAEAHPANNDAVEVIRKINDTGLMLDCIQEKKTALRFGTGCLQHFGVATISYGNKHALYAAGRDASGGSFIDWQGLPKLSLEGKTFFNTSDFMGSFFEYEYFNDIEIGEEPVVYVANYKAVQQESTRQQLQTKKVWTAGTRTWFELARKGIWVEGCADAFGLESLDKVWGMPVINIRKEDILVLTHQQAARNWQEKGWKTNASYFLKAEIKPELLLPVQNADAIFWSSFQQYEQSKKLLKQDVIHLCSHGETASLLIAAGVSPIIFPNIKAFQQWRRSFIRSRSAA